MKPSKFKAIFAWKNIVKYPGSSFTVWLSLALTSMFVILIANIFFMFEQLFYYRAVETYEKIDIVVTFDENSTSRLINRRNLEDDYDDEISRGLSFFNLNVVASTETDDFYVELMSANPYELEALIDIDIENLSASEIVISRTLAEEKGYVQGDQLDLRMLDNVYSYTVVQIIEDKGLFSGQKVFVDKTKLIEDYFGISGLDHLGNTIYIDLEVEIDPDDFFDTLSEDPDYSDNLIIKAIDWNAIRNDSSYTASVLAGIGVLIVITLGMVIHSLFPLFVQKLRHQYGTITNLGGQAGFLRGIWFIQLAIIFGFAFMIGILGAYLTINMAGKAYSLDSFINLNAANTILAMAIIASFIAFEGWFVFRNMKKSGLIGLSTDYRYEKHKTSTIYLAVLLAGLLLMIIFKPFETAIDSFLIVILSLFAGFQVISFVLEKATGSSLRKKPRNLFQAFNLKYMADNKYIHNSLRVLFASFVVVATTLSVRVFVINEVDFFIDQINFDFAMTNITNYDDALKTEIIQNYAVEAVDEVIFYKDVKLLIDSHGEIEKEKMQFFVSLEADRFYEYFNFDYVEPMNFDGLGNDEVYVVIPKSLGKIYDLEIGETISLLINFKHDIIDVEIAGFLDTNFDNVVYTNLLFVPEYEDEFSINTLLIQSDEEDDIFIELLEDYGSEMYYVLDINALINDFGSIYKTASSLFLVLTSIMIVSFLVVIMNNTLLVFQTMKHDYAKLKTLGVSNSEFGKCIAYEIGLGFSLVLVFSAFEVALLSEFMPEIMLFFNYYKEISPTPYVLILSVIIVFVAYVASYLLYYIKIGKIQITNEIYKE